jgi:hypothetical protein
LIVSTLYETELISEFVQMVGEFVNKRDRMGRESNLSLDELATACWRCAAAWIYISIRDLITDL